MLQVGQRVRVLPPFAESFPGERVIVDPPVAPAGYVGDWPLPDCFWIDCVEGAFSAAYLEVVQ